MATTARTTNPATRPTLVATVRLIEVVSVFESVGCGVIKLAFMHTGSGTKYPEEFSTVQAVKKTTRINMMHYTVL